MIDPTPDPAIARPPGTPRWVKALGLILVAVVAIAIGVMVISGGQHGPGMHTGSAPATALPSSAAAAGGRVVGGPADPSQAARTIAVTTLDSMAFEPASVSVDAGEVVTFVVTNHGQATHEFTLGDAEMQTEHAEAMGHMPEGMRHELPNSIAIEPGATGTLTWRFGSAGALEFACHEPGHYDAGMRGAITVG
jgi:uncharacterized cupredoxin-like copper-binding protein